MSWDIVLFSSSQKIITIEELDEAKLIQVDFNALIKMHFNNIVESEGVVEIKGSDYTIVGYFTDNEPASNTLLNLYGENAIYAMIEFSRKNNFQIFDTGLGEMIDLQKPEKNGYQDFQNYLAYIIKR